MNLNKFFTYIYLLTFSLMFFLLGASELRESADFIFFGASREALVVSSLNEGLMDFPDSEKTSTEIMARFRSGDKTEVRAVSQAFFTHLKPGDSVSVYVLGKRRYVKINSFMSLYAKGLFYLLVACASALACAWSLNKPTPKSLKKKHQLFSPAFLPSSNVLSAGIAKTRLRAQLETDLAANLRDSSGAKAGGSGSASALSFSSTTNSGSQTLESEAGLTA